MRSRCSEANFVGCVAEFARIPTWAPRGPSMMVLVSVRVPCVGVMMPVPVPMTVPVGMGRRIEVDLRRRPVEDGLQPAAEEHDRNQGADVAELPPEIGDGDDRQAIATCR